jgi:hypothetical protein
MERRGGPALRLRPAKRGAAAGTRDANGDFLIYFSHGNFSLWLGLPIHFPLTSCGRSSAEGGSGGRSGTGSDGDRKGDRGPEPGGSRELSGLRTRGGRRRSLRGPAERSWLLRLPQTLNEEDHLKRHSSPSHLPTHGLVLESFHPAAPGRSGPQV